VFGGKKRGADDASAETLPHTPECSRALKRLCDCIERGRTLVSDELRVVASYTEDVKAVWRLLQPENGTNELRRAEFDMLVAQYENSEDLLQKHMGKTMRSFAPGLFAGGDDLELPVDNLDLERAFRVPKSHERRIHGHAHAGVRIVQQGPTLIPALDAHKRHSEPFTYEELFAYAEATVPVEQQESERRRGLMRQARSHKNRGTLLAELERQFNGRPLAT
jgi:hypothetical protein